MSQSPHRHTLSPQLSLSRIIQGFWRMDQWQRTPAENEAFIRGCLELGVTSLDTAEIYGSSEAQIGAVLAQAPDLRHKVELISKMGIYRAERPQGRFTYYDTSYQRILEACEGSLRRLHTDYLDLYLIHREDPFIDFDETARGLLHLLESGKVRAIGVSNFDPEKFSALQAATGGRLVTNQIEWNPLCHEHVQTGLIDRLTASRIAPMIWSPLAGGRLFHPKTECEQRCAAVLQRLADECGLPLSTLVYAWLLAHPVHGLPISGSQSLARLQEATAALDVHLPRPVWYEIYTASGDAILR